jgi:hypothetical protein
MLLLQLVLQEEKIDEKARERDDDMEDWKEEEWLKQGALGRERRKDNRRSRSRRTRRMRRFRRRWWRRMRRGV